ncbi:hypothetical protein J6590_098010, partial [Homalodisca vitripennis]
MLEVRNDIREVNISRSGIGDDRVDVTYTSGGAIKSSVSRDYCSPHLFADDCQLHMPYGQDMLGKAIGQINSDLLSVSLWSVTNDHNLNTVKCTVLHVAPHTTVQILGEKNRQIRVYGSILERQVSRPPRDTSYAALLSACLTSPSLTQTWKYRTGVLSDSSADHFQLSSTLGLRT